MDKLKNFKNEIFVPKDRIGNFDYEHRWFWNNSKKEDKENKKIIDGISYNLHLQKK